MRLLFFYMLLSLGVMANLASEARLAIAQGRYDHVYDMLSTEKKLSPELSVMLLEASVMSGKGTEKATNYLKDLDNAEFISKREFWLAINELREGEFGKALRSLNELYRNKDTVYRDVIRRNITQIYLGLGNQEEALRVILEGNITDSYADRMLYAQALIAKGDYPEARAILTSGILEEVESIDKVFALARILYFEGEVEAAKERLETVEFNPLSLAGRRMINYVALIKGETQEQGGYDLMLPVLRNTTKDDPHLVYLDQLLVSAQVDKISDEQIRQDLKALGEIWNEKLQPDLLFTRAQLERELSSKITLLVEIANKYPASTLADKASLLAGQLAVQIEDPQAMRQQLEKVVSSAASDPVKAKVYSWIAESTTGREKAEFYKKAIAVANAVQKPKLKLNYNLAQFYLPSEKQKVLPLSDEQLSIYIFESSLPMMRSKPEEAQKLLEQFLQVSTGDDREGLAHLMLAEIKLMKADPNLGNAIKAHLDTVQSAYPSVSADMGDRFEIAQLRLAVLVNNEGLTRKIIDSRSNNKGNLMNSGKILYDLGKYQLASKQFQKLDALELSDTEKKLAKFYSSLCYLKLGLSEYEERGLSGLMEISASKGVLSDEAKLSLAQYYLDLGDAESSLKYCAGLPDSYRSNSLRARAHSLIDKPENKKQAKLSYDKLYRDSSHPTEQRYLVVQQYAKFLEKAELYTEEAELYHQLVNFEVIPEPDSDVSWKAFKSMCDRAVALLEGLGQWKNAYNYAKLVATTNLPDKEYFSEKAKEISLNHILWEA